MIRDEETYLENFYRDCFAELAFPFGDTHMKTNQFIEVLSKENFSFLFDGRKLKDRFMNYASHLSSPHRSPDRTESLNTLNNENRNSHTKVVDSNLASKVNEKRQQIEEGHRTSSLVRNESPGRFSSYL